MADSLVDALKEIEDTYAASDPALIGAHELAGQKIDLRKASAGGGFLAGFLQSAGVGGLSQLGTSDVMAKKAALNKDYSDAMANPDDASKIDAFKKNSKLSPMLGALLLHQQAANEALGGGRAAEMFKQLGPGAPAFRQDLGGNITRQGGDAPLQGNPNDPASQAFYGGINSGLPADVAKEKARNVIANDQLRTQNAIGQENEQKKTVNDRATDYLTQAQNLNHISQQLHAATNTLGDMGGPNYDFKSFFNDLKGRVNDPDALRKIGAIKTYETVKPLLLGASPTPGLAKGGQFLDKLVSSSVINAEDTKESKQSSLDMMDGRVKYLSQYGNFIRAAQKAGANELDADTKAAQFDEKYPLYLSDPNTGLPSINKNRPSLLKYYGIDDPNDDSETKGLDKGSLQKEASMLVAEGKSKAEVSAILRSKYGG